MLFEKPGGSHRIIIIPWCARVTVKCLAFWLFQFTQFVHGNVRNWSVCNTNTNIPMGVHTCGYKSYKQISSPHDIIAISLWFVLAFYCDRETTANISASIVFVSTFHFTDTQIQIDWIAPLLVFGNLASVLAQPERRSAHLLNFLRYLLTFNIVAGFSLSFYVTRIILSSFVWHFIVFFVLFAKMRLQSLLMNCPPYESSMHLFDDPTFGGFDRNNNHFDDFKE